MNVAYDKFNTQDVAKIIGVAPQTITAWVRSGLIKAINISDGTEKARYMFTDDEVTRVQNLIKEHGTKKWMLYSKKEVEAKKDIKLAIITAPQITEQASAKKFDADKIMDKILKLQDLKEQLENLEAERNQVMNEIEALRKEVMEVI